MSEKLWYLKNCQLFERLAPEQMRHLESHSRARSFPRKSPIYLPADEAQVVYLLASGRIKICHITPDGKQSILAFIEPGELFGELAIIEPGPREEYAEAIDPATVIMIPSQQIQARISQMTPFALACNLRQPLENKRI